MRWPKIIRHDGGNEGPRLPDRDVTHPPDLDTFKEVVKADVQRPSSITGQETYDQILPLPRLNSPVSDSTFFPYPLMNGETLMEWGLKHLSPHQDEAKFLAFLSLYGPNGVTLRDLITFARLRASAIPSKNHWLLSGEVGPILRPVGDASLPTHCSF